MSDFLSDASVKIEELIESGEDPNDAARRVIHNMDSVVLLDAEMKLLSRWKHKKRGEWAEPEERPNQLRLSLDGVDLAIADTPVRIAVDGDYTFKPARFSTGAERMESNKARYDHHQSHIRRVESEMNREVAQISAAAQLGIDLENTPWDEVKHKAEGTICWRCGGGYREGDPFEYGHSDRPKSEGGVKVEWEHRSCNRSARANPVARPEPAA